MTKIKFETNLSLTNLNGVPWLFDKKYFDDIPNKPGVYIVGVKIKVNGQGENFCPLYVGIRDDLNSRIKAHWKPNGYLNGKKELFDLSIDINKIYSDINLYNKCWMNSTKSNDNKILLPERIKTLLWFNSPLFFDKYLDLLIGSSQYRDSKDWHNGTLNKDLPDLAKRFSNKQNQIKHLIDKISNTKSIICSKYFYAFYEHKVDESYKEIKPKLELIEAATKLALEKINIHTYGHTSGNGKKLNLVSSENITIDLSNLKEDLIKIGTHSYRELKIKI